MRSIRVLAALAIAVSVPSAALSAAPPLPDQRAAAPAGRAILVCAEDAATRRAFARDYGAQPVFITAREARAVRPSDPAWTAPRCMTEREHARWRDAAEANARVP